MTPNGAPIATLIPRARQGSEVALGALFDIYRAYLHLLAQMQISRQLQPKLNPSDVVQEAFLRMKAGIGEFRGTSETELVAWLRRILARTLADQVRLFEGTAKRSIQLERRLDQDLDRSSFCLQQALPSDSSSPSQRAERREEAVLVADALERLPSHYREVIVLRSFEELSFPEVAEKMQRTVTSVKRLWPRALERLGRELSRT